METQIQVEPILSVENISVHYGAIHALKNVSFKLAKGEIFSVIGANGAGKSTLLRAISGLVPLSGGIVLFRNEIISALRAHEIVKRRICHAPEGRGIFLNLTTEENLDLGAWSVLDKQTLKGDLEKVYQYFPRLKERRNQSAGTLSGGEQQMLSIGRALMGRPEILLLDEPSLGLAPQLIETIFEIIKQINRSGKTVLLVEQNALQALEVASHGIVLETGRVVLRGSAKELLASEDVKKAYLGN